MSCRAAALPSCLRTLAELDPGHLAEHRTILVAFGSAAAQRAFVRELLVTTIFARRAQTPEARHAAHMWARLERNL